MSYGHHGFGSVSIAESSRIVNSIFAFFVIVSIHLISDESMGNGSIATGLFGLPESPERGKKKPLLARIGRS